MKILLHLVEETAAFSRLVQMVGEKAGNGTSATWIFVDLTQIDQPQLILILMNQCIGNQCMISYLEGVNISI